MLAAIATSVWATHRALKKGRRERPQLSSFSRSVRARLNRLPIDSGSPERARRAAPREYLDVEAHTLDEQREALLVNLRRELELADSATERVRRIFEHSQWISQGNPEATKHPMTRAQCRQIRAQAGPEPQTSPRCGAPNMAPLFDPTRGQTEADSRVCIDRFEFPDIPCEYPLVWVRANEAAELCEAVGKRICDAHEWEGACAGALRDPDREYAWGERRLQMEYLHNLDREVIWSYGPAKDHSLCATSSHKDPECTEMGWKGCGTNTYPSGAFPRCVSPFGVYDLHGNVAEHMNLPRVPAELASRGGSGETEMKGSWFIFSTYEAHPDDCRWRARSWHTTRLRDPESHRNYHLGFRCCKDIAPGVENR